MSMACVLLAMLLWVNLQPVVKDEQWLKHAVAHSIRRPDDVLEIVGYYLAKHSGLGYKKGLPAALKKKQSL